MSSLLAIEKKAMADAPWSPMPPGPFTDADQRSG